ncbi:mRNA-decapping enzyme-like protein [Phragmites australis]|uniref:mRNA-decapping enzyme-like protein n=1 Tax=Phragmites australis TaxID=29695 RepID=UPI002D7701B9|nr:mRNA-decapping enzyme-like protein [Phragmites australis]
MARSRRGGGGGKVTPNLVWDQEGTRVLNLSVLRRLDPAVTDILITAAHVATYSFDEEILEWSRKPVEGSLFVVKRNTQPRFQLVVMNRLNTENLVEDVLTDFEYQVQVPYVMYRNAAEEITGIWFYNPQECEEVAYLFSRIQYAYSRASPKANLSSKSGFEELEAASGPSAVPAAQDTLEQSTSPTMVPDDVNEFVAAISKADACVDDMIGGTKTVRQNQSLRTVPSPSHESHSASASQPSAFHNLLPSRTLSVPVRPFDAHISSSTTIQPASLVKPALLAPMASTQTTMANASSSLSVVPPLHPPLALHQPQSAPLHQPFPLPTVSPSPLYGTPLLQPFPPPKPSPLLTPAAFYGLVLTRDQVRGALLRLVQNDNFIDMIYLEMVKRPYP